MKTTYQQIWEQKKWTTAWNKSLVIPLPNMRSLRQCQDCRTISLTSHPCKVMQASEQDGVGPTVERIFNCRVVIAKHQLGECFRASRRRQKGVFTLSFSVQFHPERIIYETLNEQHIAISIGDWLVCRLRFADDIDLMGAATTNCKN